jgi:cytochrome c oxidase assembly factor CtaG
LLPLILVAVSLLLYLRGLRLTRRRQTWRTVAFAGALATLLIALEPPLDGQVDHHLWAHKTQHVLLMAVAAPLLVLGAPWMQIWRGFPLDIRRPVAKTVLTSRGWAPVRAFCRFVARPWVAWALFNAAIAVWHIPGADDRTLRNQGIHDLEHLSFLLLGVLFWAQIADSPPFHARLDLPHRVGYLTLGAAASWVLAVVLALARTPIYPAYAQPHGMNPLADQQLAAGVMWGLGSIPFAIAIFVLLYRWLAPQLRAEPAHT